MKTTPMPQIPNFQPFRLAPKSRKNMSLSKKTLCSGNNATKSSKSSSTASPWPSWPNGATAPNWPPSSWPASTTWLEFASEVFWVTPFVQGALSWLVPWWPRRSVSELSLSSELWFSWPLRSRRCFLIRRRKWLKLMFNLAFNVEFNVIFPYFSVFPNSFPSL